MADNTHTPETSQDNGYKAMDTWRIVGRADMNPEQIAAWYEAHQATMVEFPQDEAERGYAQAAMNAYHNR